MEMTDLISYLIIGIVVFGGWIGGAIKKAEEARLRRQRANQEPSTPPPPSPSDAPPARRSRISLEPTNLTTSQQTERARAKAHYEQRIARQRQQTASSAATPSAAATPPPPPDRIDLPRPRPARSRPVVTMPSRQRADRATRRANPAYTASTPPDPRSQDPQPHTLSPIEIDAYHQYDSTTHRLLSDQPADSPTTSKPLHLTLTPQTLRDIIIYKEVLDPPLALRRSF
jgi:hypothetical protein